MGSYCLINREFQFYKMKSYGDEQWSWLHNNVNVVVLNILLNCTLKKLR